MFVFLNMGRSVAPMDPLLTPSPPPYPSAYAQQVGEPWSFILNSYILTKSLWFNNDLKNH